MRDCGKAMSRTLWATRKPSLANTNPARAAWIYSNLKTYAARSGVNVTVKTILITGE